MSEPYVTLTIIVLCDSTSGFFGTTLASKTVSNPGLSELEVCPP